MDNQEQIKEIINYRDHLSQIIHRELNLDIVAAIWIRKFAKQWRNGHNFDDVKD